MNLRRALGAACVFGAVAVLAGACSDSSSDDTSEQQLSAVTAERDALQAEVDRAAERHDKTAEVKAGIREILDDPEAFGTEDEIADLLGGFATDAAVMQDDVFGSVPMRDAWYRTLYSDAMDAEIEVFHQWISDDGSQSGSLWVWRGTNQAGNPFELIGVALDTHDEEGLVAHELVIYPYTDEYVDEAVTGTGTG